MGTIVSSLVSKHLYALENKCDWQFVNLVKLIINDFDQYLWHCYHPVFVRQHNNLDQTQ